MISDQLYALAADDATVEFCAEALQTRIALGRLEDFEELAVVVLRAAAQRIENFENEVRRRVAAIGD